MILDNGKILAVVLLTVPAVTAVRLVSTLVMSWVEGVDIWPRDILITMGILAPLALWSWGLYEFAYWIAG